MFLWKKRIPKIPKTPKSPELFPHFDKSIKLYNKALRLEKAGKIDKAIKIYQNIRKYRTPGISL